MSQTFIEEISNMPTSMLRRRVLAAGLGMALAGTLASCAGPLARGGGREVGHGSADQERQLKEELKRFADSGYHPATTFEVVSVSDIWFNGSEEIGVSLLLPQGTEQHPLVIYLPGLGESVTSGMLWRNAWAGAGYAVLAVQPIDAQQAWASQEARNADFSAIIHTHFSMGALSSRVVTLQFALGELERRIRSGVQPYARVDNSRMAVAGYDLGAQVAQLLSGERMRGVDAPALPALSAVLVLSPYVATPYVDVSTDTLVGRYSNIRVPCLGITGSEDLDDYGMVPDAAVRQTPFQYMAPVAKYLLSLNGGSHRFLAGKPVEAALDIPFPAAMPGDGGAGSGKHRSKGEGPGARRSGSDRRSGRVQRMPEGNQFLSRAELERQAITVQTVSTAFLDAAVKNRDQAWQWLVGDVIQWIDHQAKLMRK